MGSTSQTSNINVHARFLEDQSVNTHLGPSVWSTNLTIMYLP